MLADAEHVLLGGKVKRLVKQVENKEIVTIKQELLNAGRPAADAYIVPICSILKVFALSI